MNDMDALTVTLQRLEAAAAKTVERVELDTMRVIVDGVLTRSDIGKLAEDTHIAEEEVFSLVGKLGTWLTHVHGSPDAEIVSERGRQGHLFAGLVDDLDPTQVLVPIGFERFGPDRRSVAKAYAAIATYKPDDGVLIRFLDRMYPPETDVIDAQMVFTIWGFFRLGRIADVCDVTETPSFNRAAADSIVLLQSALQRAEQALEVFCEMDAAPESVIDACRMAPWVDEGRIRRLERLATLAAKTGSRSMRAEQRSIAAEAHIPGRWTFTNPAELSEGQVLRICEAAGFRVDSRRSEENEIRKRLVDLGFGADVDRLLPEGLRALDAGFEDEFWDALSARRSGDPEWRERLYEAVAYD